MSKEICQKIRAELKALGYNSRQVSVTNRRGGYGDSMRIKIKDYVNINVVEAIAEKYEHVRYCEYSGEILAGGNTFIHVEYDWEWLRDERQQYATVAEKIINTTERKQGYYTRIFDENDKFVGFDGYEIIVSIPESNDQGYVHAVTERYVAHNAYAISESLVRIKAKHNINVSYKQ
jgi:hypothetical protein